MGTSGGPGKIDDLNYGSQLQGMAQRADRRGAELYKETQPLFHEQVSQALEALRTGGVGAKIPIIQRAVEQSKIAGSNATASAQDRLRSAGLAGTPFGQGIINNVATQGALQTSNIPTAYAQQVASGAPGLSGQGFGASGNYGSLGGNILGNLQQMDLSRQQSNAESFRDMMNHIQATASSIGSSAGAACLHPDTEIDTPAGPRFISSLTIGDTVWSQDERGSIVPAKVSARCTIPVGPEHVLARVDGPTSSFYVTPVHPLPSGEPIVPIPALVHTRRGLSRVTMDIAVDGPTGIYFAGGRALGSTLDSRHARKAA